MNTKLSASIAITAGLALGIAMSGGAAKAAEPSAQESSSAQAAPAVDQQKIADTTQKLEGAFNDQFVRGKIDPTALSGEIRDVVDAMPEAARPKVKEHISQVLQTGAKLVAALTPEQRAEAAAPPAAEKVGKTSQAIVAAWGWPGMMGWGGYGAFGFPGMYGAMGWGVPGWGLGYAGLGYGLGYGVGYGAAYATGYGMYGAYGYPGWGLGCGGWYW
jgi:hypothetical protein